MVRIDNPHSVDFNKMQAVSSARGQVSPGAQVGHLAAAELANIRSEAMEETMEGLSLGLSRYKKQLTTSKESRDFRFDALEKLFQQLDHEQATRVNQYVDTLAVLGNGDKILSQLQAQGMDSGQVMLMLMALVMSGKLSETVRKQLKKALSELLSQEGAEIALYAAMDGVVLDESGLQALKQLYQQASRGEAGLAKWFDDLRHLPDRRQKLRLLLRVLSEPLSDKAAARQMTKVVAVVAELRRLLIFLTLEEHCQTLAKAVGIKTDDVLVLTLKLIEQAWVYPQWLADQINQLAVLPARRISFLRRWKELVSMTSVECFREVEQKDNTESAMLTLLDEWCEQE